LSIDELYLTDFGCWDFCTWFRIESTGQQDRDEDNAYILAMQHQTLVSGLDF
jgi:hypothetical protein